MTEINLMLEFIKNYRMNDYFLNHAISELKVGFILSEYLNSDQMSTFEPDKEIKNKLISPNRKEQIEAVDTIIEEMNLELKSPFKIREVLDYLVPIYLDNNATEKDKRRRELLLELQTLDASN